MSDVWGYIKNPLKDLVKEYVVEPLALFMGSKLKLRINNLYDDLTLWMTQNFNFELFTDIFNLLSGFSMDTKTAEWLNDRLSKEYDLATKLLKYDYEYLNFPEKEWYDFSFEATDGGIEYYMTIKIRSVLTKIIKVKGYPVRFGHGISFDSGLGIWIPALWKIDQYATMLYWIEDKSRAWRECKIRFQGSDRLRQLIQAIPFNIGQVLDIFTAENTIRYRVADSFQRISFPNTLNDRVILGNWKEIREYLNKHEY